MTVCCPDFGYWFNDDSCPPYVCVPSWNIVVRMTQQIRFVCMYLAAQCLKLWMLKCPIVLLQSTLSSRAYMRGYTAFDPSDPASLSFSAVTAAAASSSSSYQTTGRRYQAPRAAIGDYAQYPEGRPIFLPEAERYGNPPDLPSLLLQQRIIYISMPVCYNTRCEPLPVLEM